MFRRSFKSAEEQLLSRLDSLNAVSVTVLVTDQQCLRNNEFPVQESQQGAQGRSC